MREGKLEQVSLGDSKKTGSVEAEVTSCGRPFQNPESNQNALYDYIQTPGVYGVGDFISGGRCLDETLGYCILYVGLYCTVVRKKV